MHLPLCRTLCLCMQCPVRAGVYSWFGSGLQRSLWQSGWKADGMLSLQSRSDRKINTVNEGEERKGACLKSGSWRVEQRDRWIILFQKPEHALVKEPYMFWCVVPQTHIPDLTACTHTAVWGYTFLGWCQISIRRGSGLCLCVRVFRVAGRDAWYCFFGCRRNVNSGR